MSGRQFICPLPPYCHSLRHQVLKLHSIEVLELHGDVDPATRVEIRQRFKASTHDGPHVLLMSGVGVLGLNIPHPNILIKVVCDPSFLPMLVYSNPFPDL